MNNNTQQELTVAEVVAVFQTYQITNNSFEYHLNQPNNERFGKNDWENLTKLLLEKFTPNTITHLNVNYDKQIIGAYVDSIDKHIWYENLTRFTWISLYPSVISNKIESGELHFNYSEYGKVYRWILLNRGEIKKYCYEHSLDTYTTIKFYINFLFGMLNHTNSLITSNISPSDIVKFCRNIMYTLHMKYKHNIICVNTDEIYINNFKDIEYEFIDDIKSYDFLNYEITNNIEGAFFGKKKSILLEDGLLKKKGFRIR